MQILKTLRSYITLGLIQQLAVATTCIGILLLDIDISYRLIILGSLIFALSFLVET